MSNISFCTIRGYDARRFLQELFGTEISIKCWLDFRTFFNGELGFYQELSFALQYKNKTLFATEEISSNFDECKALLVDYKKAGLSIKEDFMGTFGTKIKINNS